MVDSSFFWGYIVTQIPGGFLAARFPANRVFGSAIATSALLNMLLPIAAKAGFQYVMLLRILQGLVEVSTVGLDLWLAWPLLAGSAPIDFRTGRQRAQMNGMRVLSTRQQ